jgi:hypothetical protein
MFKFKDFVKFEKVWRILRKIFGKFREFLWKFLRIFANFEEFGNFVYLNNFAHQKSLSNPKNYAIYV